MNLSTKGDLITAALRKLGVASNATLTDIEPQSMEDGVNDLELMMAEWAGGVESPGISVGYLFSPAGEPADAGDEHGIGIAAINAVILNIACRIAPDYGMEATAKLLVTAKYGKEQLVKLSAMSRARTAKCKSGYPNRMPTGSGNRLAAHNGWNFYHRDEVCNADTTTPADEGDG
ncbi:packaged DNA stabilization gp4 family protein [Erwinia aphidicola]|uniref:packaged DNA stabilization gp4 family protein n=1 Tax=Erwinia aphidicola TaxID=68334 RepID=UPI0030D3C2C3